MALTPYGLENIERRLRALEAIVSGNIDYVADVTRVDDPENLGRIRVHCEALWGAEESPWCHIRSATGGDNRGTVETPVVGDLVYVSLLNGNPSVPVVKGFARTPDAVPPQEFSDPLVNGEKTRSGILIVKDDKEKSYWIRVPGGAKVYIGDSKVVLNDGRFGVVTSCPEHQCPLFGPHRGSTTVLAKE